MNVQKLVRVPSFRKDGPGYVIERYQQSAQAAPELRCECPPFNMGPRKGQECKHLRIYRAAVAATSRCGLAGHSAFAYEQPAEDHRPALCLQCLVAMLAVAAGKVAREYRPKPPKKVALCACGCPRTEHSEYTEACRRCGCGKYEKAKRRGKRGKADGAGAKGAGAARG